MARKSSSSSLAVAGAELASSEPTHAHALAPNERRLNFGDKWSYAPAPETSPVKIEPRYELFIDGKFVAPKSGGYFPSINPANEKKLAEIAEGSAEDVDAAVKAARRAYEKVW